jgi:hypothetical protein
MATTAQATDSAPARKVTQKRVSASSTRTFDATSGEVEIAPNTTAPRYSAETSIATTASGATAIFWALRASISIFNEESQQVIKVERAVHDLPHVKEPFKSLVHEDSFWNTKDPRTQRSPGDQFKGHTAALLRYTETAALLAEREGRTREEIQRHATKYLDAHLKTLQNVLQELLQSRNTGAIELVRAEDGC